MLALVFGVSAISSRNSSYISALSSASVAPCMAAQASQVAHHSAGVEAQNVAGDHRNAAHAKPR